MTLSASLSSALSGLTAASRAAEVVSSNVANAMTEGYGRREVSLSARMIGRTGNGVMVNGVVRMTSMVAVGDRRPATGGCRVGRHVDAGGVLPDAGGIFGLAGRWKLAVRTHFGV